MDAKLVVVGGQANKTEIKMKLPMTIGRNAGLGLTINHNMVSRLHCQIYEREGALIVRDNNSSNGTLINNQKISEAVLKPGDRLSVGPLTFVAIYQHSGPFPTLGGKAPATGAAAGAKPAAPAPKPATPAPKPAAPPLQAPSPEVGGVWSDQGSLFEEAVSPDDLLFGGDRAQGSAPFAAFETPSDEEEEGTRFFNPNTASSAGFKELDLADLVAEDEDSGQKAPAKPSLPARPAAGDSAARDFLFFVQFVEAAGVDVGTPVRAAGVAAGSVAELNYVQVDGQLRVQVELHVMRKLSSHLREDMHVVIHQGTNGLAVIEVASPGKGQAIAPGTVISALGTAQAAADEEPSAPSATGVEAHLFQHHSPAPKGPEDSFDNDNIFGKGGGVFDSSPGVLDHADDEVNLVSSPPTGMAGGGLNDFFAELTSGLDDDEEEAPSEEQQSELNKLDEAPSPDDMFGDAPLGEAVEDLPDDEPGDIPPAVTDEDDEDDRTISGQSLEELGGDNGRSLFDPLQFDDSDAHR